MNISTFFYIANSSVKVAEDGLYLLLHLLTQRSLFLLLGSISKYGQTGERHIQLQLHCQRVVASSNAHATLLG